MSATATHRWGRGRSRLSGALVSSDRSCARWRTPVSVDCRSAPIRPRSSRTACSAMPLASPRRPAADRTVELPGITILPGFIDTHVHLTATGLSMSNEDVVAARSKGELLALAAGRAAGDDEPVILLQGFDETRWDRPDHPTLEELDAVTGKPLLISRVVRHVALARSAALTF